MKDHNGVLMMQRVLLAGTLGMAMARKAAAILEGEPSHEAPSPLVPVFDCTFTPLAMAATTASL